MMIRGEMLLITDFLESYISSSDFQTQVRQGKEELWFLWGWVVFFFPQINSNFLRLQKKRRKVHIKPDLLPEELALKKKRTRKTKRQLALFEDRYGTQHRGFRSESNHKQSLAVICSWSWSWGIGAVIWTTHLKGLGSGLRAPWFGKITGSVCKTLEQGISTLAW